MHPPAACWLLYIVAALAEANIRTEMYVDLMPQFPCVRWMNATHQVGCHSPKSGNVGTVFLANTEEDLMAAVQDERKIGPFVLVVDVYLFSIAIPRLFAKLKPNTVGLIVYLDEDSKNKLQSGYSDDHTCPSSSLDLYANDTKYGQCRMAVWNPVGTGSRFFDWDIPAYLVINQTEISYITKCYELYNKWPNRTWPLCAAQLTIFNHAAGNSVLCLRRSGVAGILAMPSILCLPFDDLNIHAILPSEDDGMDIPQESVFIFASRMDSLSLFSDYSPGSTTLGSVITWLAVVEALGRQHDVIKEMNKNYNRSILLVLFHGESLDYIGSSRFVHDIAMNNLTDMSFKLSHVGFYLELSHLTNAEVHEVLMHVDPVSYNNFSKAKQRIDWAKEILAEKLPGVNSSPFDLPLPPASLHSFLKANRSIPGVVLSSYRNMFSARYYNSFLDIPLLVDKKQFVNTATDVANASLTLILQWLNNGVKYEGTESVDKNVVQELADCFFNWPTWNCTLFTRIVNSFSEEDQPYLADLIYNYTHDRTAIRMGRPRYTAVRVIGASLTQFFLGDKNCSSEANLTCTSASGSSATNCYYSLDLLSNDETPRNCCVCSTVGFSSARSPAFEVDRTEQMPNNYSTWVESVYSITQMRLFLRMDTNWQLNIFVAGMTIFIVSCLSALLVVKNGDVLFDAAPVPL